MFTLYTMLLYIPLVTLYNILLYIPLLTLYNILLYIPLLTLYNMLNKLNSTYTLVLFTERFVVWYLHFVLTICGCYINLKCNTVCILNMFQCRIYQQCYCSNSLHKRHDFNVCTRCDSLIRRLLPDSVENCTNSMQISWCIYWCIFFWLS